MEELIIKSEAPQLITPSIVKEIYELSSFLDLNDENKIIMNRLINNYKLEHLHTEGNIQKTIDNINEDLTKKSFTGKELKDIISTHKFNQYNITLLKLLENIAEHSYNIQLSKQDNKLLDTVDIFTIIYITKFLNDVSENVLLENTKDLFYEVEVLSSIFDTSDKSSNNPFLSFFKSFDKVVEFKTDAIIDTQRIDNLFYIG